MDDPRQGAGFQAEAAFPGSTRFLVLGPGEDATIIKNNPLDMPWRCTVCHLTSSLATVWAEGRQFNSAPFLLMSIPQQG